VLVHDDPHGAPLIDALAPVRRRGLPGACVLPFAVNEITQVGLESIACRLRLWRGAGIAVLAAGAARATTSRA